MESMMWFDIHAAQCAGLIESEMMAKIVQVESSGNPYAIGVVGGRLQRQPADLQEAVLTAEYLEKAGYNYSIGLSQVNRVHFKRLAWHGDVKSGFDVCQNLRAGAQVYSQCKESAARSLKTSDPASVLRAALSCYYSGNFVTGERMGYVDKVLMGSGSAKGGFSRTISVNRSMFD